MRKQMIRVAVGCAANDEDLESLAVLEYSARKHCSSDLEFTWMRLSKDPTSFWYSDGGKGWQTTKWSTPFSALRWGCAEYFGFEGRCIYMDSDCIVRADLTELWEQPLEAGKVVIAKGGKDSWRFCVSVIDCLQAACYMRPLVALRSDPDGHRKMIAKFRNASFVQKFEGNWNCIDLEDYADINDPDIKVIHYSDESAQVQLRHAIPRLAAEGRRHWFDGKTRIHWRPELQELFDSLLSEAISAGFHLKNYAPETPFGEYRKMSHKSGYRSHRFAPA